MNYQPAPVPFDARDLPGYLSRELARVAAALKDDAPTVFYLPLPADQGSLSAGISADWRVAAGNVLRISTSNTVTLTGLILPDPVPNRVLAVVNVGTGVAVLKSNDAASSASYRFALPATWQLSADAAGILWYDARSARFRGLART